MLNAKYGCGHVKEYRVEFCDRHKEKCDWMMCPWGEAKAGYEFPNDCSDCREERNKRLANSQFKHLIHDPNPEKTKRERDDRDGDDEENLPPGVVSSGNMGMEDPSGRGEKRQREG